LPRGAPPQKKTSEYWREGEKKEWGREKKGGKGPRKGRLGY